MLVAKLDFGRIFRRFFGHFLMLLNRHPGLHPEDGAAGRPGRAHRQGEAAAGPGAEAEGVPQEGGGRAEGAQGEGGEADSGEARREEEELGRRGGRGEEMLGRASGQRH